MEKPRSDILTQGTSYWLDEHLSIVRQNILDEAKRIAKLDNREGPVVEPKDIAEAAKRFAPGTEVPAKETPKQTTWQTLVEWASSPMFVSALLAIAFGILGVYRGGQGAFDIAKVFAGAIVGSAAVTVKSNIKLR